MGTNFYIKSERCECCGIEPELFHIGKNSSGWLFSLHRTGLLVNIESWLIHLVKNKDGIVDEYGRAMKLSTMIDIITDKDFGEDGLCYYNRSTNTEKVRRLGESWYMVEGEFS